jgi:hypothetical protein
MSTVRSWEKKKKKKKKKIPFPSVWLRDAVKGGKKKEKMRLREEPNTNRQNHSRLTFA